MFQINTTILNKRLEYPHIFSSFSILEPFHNNVLFSVIEKYP